MAERATTQCDQCGQTDDHPKVNLAELDSGRSTTKHHDCLSVREKQLLTDSGQEPGAPKASAIIAACEGGVRGDKLLALIQSGDLPEAEGLAHQSQLAEEAAK